MKSGEDAPWVKTGLASQWPNLNGESDGKWVDVVIEADAPATP
jgi:hypothetical protein